MEESVSVRIVHPSGTEGEWKNLDAKTEGGFMLKKGEIGIVLPDNFEDELAQPVSIKIGDGRHTWNDLPYFGTAVYMGEYCHVRDDILYGDINGDGAVTQKDDMYLTRYLDNMEGYKTLPNPQAADLDLDGAITQRDSFIMTRHYHEWEGYENLPVPTKPILPKPTVNNVNSIYKLFYDTITDNVFFEENVKLSKGSLIICLFKNEEYKYEIILNNCMTELQVNGQKVESKNGVINLTSEYLVGEHYQKSEIFNTYSGDNRNIAAQKGFRILQAVTKADYNGENYQENASYYIIEAGDISQSQLVSKLTGKKYSAHLRYYLNQDLDKSRGSQLSDYGTVLGVSEDKSTYTTEDGAEGSGYVIYVDKGFSENATDPVWGIDKLNYICTNIDYNNNPDYNALWFKEKYDFGNVNISYAAHAEGLGTKALSKGAHAHGFYTEASGSYSTAQGIYTKASGYSSFSGGSYSEARGQDSVALGSGVVATRIGSFVRGRYNVIDDEEKYIDIVGNGIRDAERKNIYTLDGEGTGWFAKEVRVGSNNLILATEKFVREGFVPLNWMNLINLKVNTNDKSLKFNDAVRSLVFGYLSQANNYWSSAFGTGSIANGNSQFVIGKYNSVDPNTATNDAGTKFGNYAFIVGNGSGNESRSNAFTVGWNGVVSASGSIVSQSNIQAAGIVTSKGKELSTKEYVDDEIDKILGSEELNKTFDTLKEIQDWILGDGVNTTELTTAIAEEANIRATQDNALQQNINKKLDANGWGVIPKNEVQYVGTGWYFNNSDEYSGTYNSSILSSQRVSFSNFSQDDETCLEEGRLTFWHSRDDGVATGNQCSGININGLFNHRTSDVYDQNTGETYPAYSHYFYYPNQSGTLIVDKDIEALDLDNKFSNKLDANNWLSTSSKTGWSYNNNEAQLTNNELSFNKNNNLTQITHQGILLKNTSTNDETYISYNSINHNSSTLQYPNQTGTLAIIPSTATEGQFLTVGKNENGIISTEAVTITIGGSY